jgi:hypothetical protein
MSVMLFTFYYAWAAGLSVQQKGVYIFYEKGRHTHGCIFSPIISVFYKQPQIELKEYFF